MLIASFLPATCLAKSRQKYDGLEYLHIYQETGLRRLLEDPDSLENPRLFKGLNRIYVANPEYEPAINRSSVMQKLRKLGIICVTREVALKEDLPFSEFECHPALDPNKFNCYLGIHDVITLKRQSKYKYWLVWWYKHLEASSQQEGYDRLFDSLIKDLSKFRRTF
jgi:hypothetical protein